MIIIIAGSKICHNLHWGVILFLPGEDSQTQAPKPEKKVNMGDTKKPTDKSRRWFLTGGLLDSRKKKEMVKMLTADGKLVEIEKSLLDAVATRQKASNKEIYKWMENPSKDNS
jgi:hypothetical protein